MARNNPRRIPEEKSATHEELTAAINGITENERRKLNKAAAYRMRGLGPAALNRDFQDLFNETVLSFLKPDGRKWKKDEIDIVRTLNEAMRSVASNWWQEYKRKAAIQTPLTIGRDDDPAEVLGNIPDSGESIQYRLETDQLHAAMKVQLDEINEIVEKREKAALIVMSMGDGLDGPQIRAELELTVQQHDLTMASMASSSPMVHGP